MANDPSSPVLSCVAPFVVSDPDLAGGTCQLSVVELVGAARSEGQVAQNRASFSFNIAPCGTFSGKRSTFLHYALSDASDVHEEHDDDAMTTDGAHTWQVDGYNADVFDTRLLATGTAFSASIFAHTQYGGQMSKPVSLPLTGNRTFEWIDVQANRSSKTIQVQVTVSISELDGSLGSLMQFVTQKILAGIGHFWSRSITLQDGSAWQVTTTAVQGSGGVSFQCMKNLWEHQRACNAGVVVNGLPVIFPYNPQKSDMSAMHTAAHEFGHSVLRGAVSDDYSLHHKGTSTGWQSSAPDAPACPATGEIDLMDYFKDESYPSNFATDYYPRSIAAQEDVKRLISMGAVVIKK